MGYIFLDAVPQVRLAQDNHSVQAFGFDAADEPLHERTEIRRQGHGLDGFDPPGPEHLDKDLGKEGISIMDEVFLMLKEAGEWISQVLGYLLHPVPIRLFHNPGNLDLSGGIVDGYQDHIAGQAFDRINFGRKEINGRQGLPMGLDKFLPGRFPPSVRLWLQTGLLEDSADGSSGDSIAQIFELSLDANIAPVAIVPGDLNNSITQLIRDLRSTHPASFRSIILLGNQHAMPAEDCVWGEDLADFGQGLPAELFA